MSEHFEDSMGQQELPCDKCGKCCYLMDKVDAEDKEHECFECGREWTRNNGRGCPYGDPTCFLCEKHEHNDCDYPERMRAEPKDPETVLFEYPNGIPHTLDDELNERTGVPHWSAVVDELADHLLGIATVDNVSTDILIGCVEDYGMALEQAVMEIHNEGLQVLVTNRAKLNEHSVVGTMDVGDLMENYGLTEVDAKAFITEHAEMIEAAMWDATWQYYKRNGLEFIPEEQREVIE